MEMSPKAIAAVTFPVVRKGYDPEQVRSFLSQLSRGVEELQNRALQAEAKARLTTTAPPPDTANMESITKTLLLAQRTADATLVEARDEAEGIRRQASERAESILAEAKAQRTQIIAAAEQEALRVGEVTRGRVAAEVDALELRRSALSDDADALVGPRGRAAGAAGGHRRRALQGARGSGEPAGAGAPDAVSGVRCRPCARPAGGRGRGTDRGRDAATGPWRPNHRPRSCSPPPGVDGGAGADVGRQLLRLPGPGIGVASGLVETAEPIDRSHHAGGAARG